VENGERVVCVLSKSPASARKAGRFLRCSLTGTDPGIIPLDTNLVFIATPHGAVEEVVLSLSRLPAFPFRGVGVCHASGMLTADALEPLRRRGATVFSFHPLQTFPRDFEPARIVPSARGIFYGVDGPPAGLRMARRLAGALEGSIIVIPPHLREFYHAACVVASNHLTALLSVLESMHRVLSGGNRRFYRVFKPIITATLNNIEETAPATALSGPVARGGTETVGRHFASVLRHAPDLLPFFGAMTLQTTILALAKGSISNEQAARMRALVDQYLKASSPTENHQ
jgi:predicted short-subunit dehydrogenase-like oxidoreductase (DUF2520 family)